MKKYAVPSEKFNQVRKSAEEMVQLCKDRNSQYAESHGVEPDIAVTEYDYWLMETRLIITALRQQGYVVSIR